MPSTDKIKFINSARTYLLFLFLIQYQLVQSQLTETGQDNSYTENQEKRTSQQREVGTLTHQVSLEYRPAWVLPIDPFYQTEEPPDLSLGFAKSGHLKYAFALPEGSFGSNIFPRTHQGVGIAVFDFGNPRELGTPIAAYLFQRSAIAQFSPHLSLDYEWNFGISAGWKPYDSETNPNNIIIGSKVNAYINLGLSLRWQFTQRLAMRGGVDFTHFSNGNTEYPNSGLNLPGIKIGMTYDVSKPANKALEEEFVLPVGFSRHFSYDFVLYGSWRRKGVEFSGEQVPSPHKYPVVGAYFAPMYNWGHRLRTGLSLDAIYDGSANVFTKDYIIGTQQEFFKPDTGRQLALGVSARIEYVMPFFTIGAGMGTNFLHKGGDFRGTYQSFALKLRTSRNSFIHIGYNLKDFHDPNHLMLGLGYRFNNKAPSLLTKHLR